ncbi:hypothetical protein H5410_001700 [Solanum commersonii]|uniref:Uncharacterized protein n=1 Tax=Solanum commersonii TaxID=4109 RepID=A0A9J6B0T9_SOLCO|nr:hypothetical protein H5410_001700 [Solanum commersonii]
MSFDTWRVQRTKLSLEFLKTGSKHTCRWDLCIGLVHKKDVMKASVMLEKKKEYATILAFDVKVTRRLRELSDEQGGLV